MVDIPQYIQIQKKLLSRLEVSLKSLSKSPIGSPKHVNILRKELTVIKKIRQGLEGDQKFLEEIDRYIEKLDTELETEEEKLKAKFGLELEELLLANGFKLEGQYPKLRSSYYTINVDIPSNKVVLFFGPEVEKLGSTRAIPEEVTKYLLLQHKKITERTLNRAEFLRKLHSAYQVYLTINKKKVGDDAPVSDIHVILLFLGQGDAFRKNPSKDTFSEYSRAMFGFDLSQLDERSVDNFELLLSTATRADTANIKNFIWIPKRKESQDGETIGRLKFMELPDVR